MLHCASNGFHLPHSRMDQICGSISTRLVEASLYISCWGPGPVWNQPEYSSELPQLRNPSEEMKQWMECNRIVALFRCRHVVVSCPSGVVSTVVFLCAGLGAGSFLPARMDVQRKATHWCHSNDMSTIPPRQLAELLADTENCLRV
jgi:hypothetical protein